MKTQQMFLKTIISSMFMSLNVRNLLSNNDNNNNNNNNNSKFIVGTCTGHQPQPIGQNRVFKF